MWLLVDQRANISSYTVPGHSRISSCVLWIHAPVERRSRLRRELHALVRLPRALTNTLRALRRPGTPRLRCHVVLVCGPSLDILIVQVGGVGRRGELGLGEDGVLLPPPAPLSELRVGPVPAEPLVPPPVEVHPCGSGRWRSG